MPGDWEKDWEMILGGGPPLWKDGEKYANYKMAYDMLVEQGAVDPAKPLRIFVPLAGDGAICPYFYHKGNSMVAAELIPEAVASLLKRFSSEEVGAVEEVRFASETTADHTIWTAQDGRAKIWTGDMFKITEENESFDMILDKDAFGAIPMELREQYVAKLAPLVKAGGYLFLEVKDKSNDPNTTVLTTGPPFHVSDDHVADTWQRYGFEPVHRIPSFFPLKYPHWTEKVIVLRKAR